MSSKYAFWSYVFKPAMASGQVPVETCLWSSAEYSEVHHWAKVSKLIASHIEEYLLYLYTVA